MNLKLPHSFYQQEDVVSVARNLLGKFLCTSIDGILTTGMISETEAYAGVTDRASHAWNERRTTRTETMYLPGGYAYVYLCYGIHDMFNVVTGPENVPHAVLIRAIKPAEGIEVIKERRKYPKKESLLANGPGSLCRALGITRDLNGTDLTENQIWIEDRGLKIPDHEILTGPRIGVDYAGEDALLPYRFFIR